MGEYGRQGKPVRSRIARGCRTDTGRHIRPNRGSRLELHTVICDKCGKETQVPFKPTGDKPVYCRECFKLTENTQSSRSDRNDRSRGQRREFNRRDDGPQMHQAICDKCGKECEVPFRPTEGKPIYCYDCFKKNDEPKAVEFEKTPMPKANEIEEINKKLDKIMKALNIE